MSKFLLCTSLMMLALPASAAGLMTDRGGAIIMAQATPAPARRPRR